MSYAYGVPLTAKESADLDARGVREGQLGQLEAALAGLNGYGGLYVDESRGGVVVIRVAGDAKVAQGLLDQLMPNGASGEVRPVERSNAELEGLRSRMLTDLGSLEKSGVNYLAVNAKSNKVIVGLERSSTAADAGLRATYGDGIDVMAKDPYYINACSSRTNCPSPSYSGGLLMTHTSDPTHSVGCTSGFGSRKTTGGLSGHWYMMTAGHCIFHGDGNGRSWSHNGVPAGISRAYQYCDRCSADIGIIEYNVWDTPTNNVYATGPTDLRPITIRRVNADQNLGTSVCRSGQKSNAYICGTIADEDVNVLIHDPRDGINRWMNHQWIMSKPGMEGDSGAPIMYSSAAYGIHSFSNSTTGGYGTLDFINGSVGYRPCISAVANPCS